MKRTSIAILAIGCAAFAQATNIYSSNFGGGDTTGWTTSDSFAPDLTVSPSGVQFLLFSNASGGQETDTLTLTGVGAGEITLDFDLYALESLDGNNPINGSDDYFILSGNSTDYIDATFSNFNGEFQGYSPATPLGGDLQDFLPKTGADTSDALGYQPFGDAEYDFGGAINPAISFYFGGGTLALSFANDASQTWEDEGFGVNNVNISETSVSSVPGPMALLPFACGALVGLRRRKRQA